MKIKGTGAGFIGQMASLRQAPEGAKAKAKGRVDGGIPAPGGGARGPAQLAELGVDAKVIKQHGADLGGALKDLGRLAAASAGRDAWQVKAFQRVLGQAHKMLGIQLTALAPAERKAAAQATAQAFADLVEAPEVRGLAPFALSAAVGLLDSALRMDARRKISFTSAELAQLGADAAATVRAMVGALAGRDGVATALNILPRLVEELELTSAGLNGKGRAALVEQVRVFVQDTLPRSEANLGDAAELAKEVSTRARQAPGKAGQVLAEAQAAIYAPLEGSRAELKARLAAPPQPAVAELYGALGAVLDANPAGPASLIDLVGRAQARLANLPAQAPFNQDPAGLAAVAELIRQAAGGPAVFGLLQVIADRGVMPPQTVEGMQALAAAVKAKDLGAAAQAMFAGLPAGVDPDAFKAAVADLGGLSPQEALLVAAAFFREAPNLGPDTGLVRGLTAQARSGRDQLLAELRGYAARWVAAAPRLANQPQLAAQRNTILAALVANTQGPTVDANHVQQAVGMLLELARSAPQADLAALVGPAASGQPGVLDLTNPKAGFVNPPLATLRQLLPRLAGSAEDQTGLLRLAMQVAKDVAFIQNGQGIQVPRVVEDFGRAIAEPAALHPAAAAKGQVALRAQQNVRGALEYVKEHPELGVDLVFTAGVHLSGPQVAWLIEKLGATRGLDTLRMLRDAVFAAVNLNRLDLVEALRTTASPRPAVNAVLKELAQALRVNALNTVPVDALVAGLNAGQDPMAAIVAEKAAQALGGLDLNALGEGKVTEAGVAEIQSLAPNIAELLTQYQTNFKSMDAEIDMGKLAPVLKEVLKSVVQGTWPTPKYEDEVGRRQMGALSPAQQAAWRQMTVVTPGQAKPEAVGPQVQEALTLLKGLAKTITEEARLPADLELKPEALAQLRGQQAELLGRLREAPRGSDAHRALSREIGPVMNKLAFLELHFALQGLGEAKDGARALAELRPTLEAGQRALQKFGAKVSASAVEDVLYVARGLVKTNAVARTGRYAMDDDSLTGLIASHKSGCLSFGDRRRRWGLAGSLSDANTKMLRVMDGEKQLYRTFMRVLPARIGNYQGPVLFIENPVGDSGGSAADRDLMEAALHAKAAQMGIPAVGGQAKAPEGWKVLNTQVNLTFDYGHTGLYHSDRLGQLKFQANVGQSMDSATHAVVVVPPGLADQF